MTDLLRLATELERSGGMHRFIALVQAASLVLLRFEHGESVTVRGERWPLPTVEGAPDADVAVGGTTEGVEPRGQKSNVLQTTYSKVCFEPAQNGSGITHAPDSPIPDLVREPARRRVPRYPTNPAHDEGDMA